MENTIKDKFILMKTFWSMFVFSMILAAPLFKGDNHNNILQKILLLADMSSSSSYLNISNMEWDLSNVLHNHQSRPESMKVENMILLTS